MSRRLPKKKLTIEEEIKLLKADVRKNYRYCKMNHKWITHILAVIDKLKKGGDTNQ